MSRRVADLLIKIGADSYEFQQKVNKVEKDLGSLSKRLTSVGKELSMKLTAPLAALGTVSIMNADTQAKAEAKVQQALKTTNQAVGLNFDQLTKYASELQGKTLFGDETILNDSTARLLAFTNITGENFKRTQALALDLSTALKMDLGSATLQLGKALSDPLTKLSSLSRAGITFSAEQTEMIKTMAKTGQTAKAQSMILDELERKFGGQAEAAAKVGMGALTQLKNSWGDFLEQIGQTIMPFVNKIAEGLKNVVARLQQLSPQSRKIVVIVAGIAAAIGPVMLTVGSLIKMLPTLGAGFAAMVSPIGLAVAAVLALGAAFFYAYRRKRELQDEKVKEYSSLTTDTLESMLRENQRRQEVNERESPFQGNSIASKLTYAANKDDRRRALKDEEEVLTRAIAQRREEQAQAAKVEAEEAAVMAKLTTATAIQSDTVETSTGLIGTLQAKIEALNKRKLLPATTESDLAAINVEIEQLQKKLSRLQSIKPEDLNIAKQTAILPGLKSTSSVTALPTFIAPTPKLELLASEYERQMTELHDTVRSGLFDWTGEVSEKVTNDIVTTDKIVGTYTDALVKKGWNFRSALEEVSSKVAEVMKSFDREVERFLSDSIVAAAEAVGQILTGDIGFGGLLNAILSQFSSFLKQIGSQLIEFGVMMLGFKSALKSVLSNPWAAIGIGAAMVAAAAVMTALINRNAQQNVPALANGGLAYGQTYAMVGDNPNARVDPEVIAPLSKLQAMLPAGGTAQNINITLGGQLTAKGRDLVYILGKENFKIGVLGG